MDAFRLQSSLPKTAYNLKNYTLFKQTFTAHFTGYSDSSYSFLCKINATFFQEAMEGKNVLSREPPLSYLQSLAAC